MIEGVGRIRRAVGCIAGAAILGISIELIAPLIMPWFHITSRDVALIIALPLCLGLGAALGLDMAATWQSRVAAQRPAWARILVGIFAAAALLLLDVLGGALVVPLSHARSAAALVEGEIGVACAVFGVAAAAMVTNWRVGNAGRATLLAVVLGVLATLCFMWGYLVTVSLTFHCPAYARCATHDWRDSILPASLYFVLPIGIWLGVMLWGALTLGRRAVASQPALGTH